MATTQPYQIAFTRELTVPQNAIVGEIAPVEKQFKCEIIVNDALVAKYERRDICLSLLPLKPLEIPQYKLIITADFLRKLQKKDATAFSSFITSWGISTIRILSMKRNPMKKSRH